MRFLVVEDEEKVGEAFDKMVAQTTEALRTYQANAALLLLTPFLQPLLTSTQQAQDTPSR